MAFILDAQRHVDCRLAYMLYRKYLEDNKWRFPASAFALAASDWWHNFNDRRCPHDGSIISVEIADSEAPDGSTECSIKVLLAGAWGRERHEIIYSGIREYDLAAESPQLNRGHGDWCYDEFRVDGNKNVIHEIEWTNGARWVIVCRDIGHTCLMDSSEEDDSESTVSG